MWHGSYILLAQLRKLNNDVSRQIALIDQKGTVILTSPDGITANGFDPDVINFNGYGFKDGAKPDSYNFDIVISDPVTFYDQMKAVGTGQNLRRTLKGLLPITLQLGTCTDESILVIPKSGPTFMEPLYSTAMADKTLYKLTKASDGTDKPITTCTKDDTNKGFTLVPTTALTTGVDYILSMVGPATLEAADIGTSEQGYEAVPVIVNIPD